MSDTEPVRRSEHEKLVMRVDKIEERTGEFRDQLRDIRALLLVLIFVSAPNLISHLMSVMGHH